MERREVISGLVTGVRKYSDDFSLVTLIPFFEDTNRIVIPIYFNKDLVRSYAGRVVDIINERNGLVGRDFRQSINGADKSLTVGMSYFKSQQLIKEVLDHLKIFPYIFEGFRNTSI